MNTAQVIPFRFDTREIRTLLIDDQPWFVAMDVAAALQYSDAQAMTRKLDDDEIQNRQIVGFGNRGAAVINESGLYSAILRSRKDEAKRFKKWVTAEVLPEIRRTGRYDIATATVGTDGLHILHELIGKKLKTIPTPSRRKARARLWGLVHTRFNVPRAELIPAGELDAACNFIAACAIEGEYLPSAGETGLCEADAVNLAALSHHMMEAHALFKHYRIYDACKMLGSPAGQELYGRLTDGAAIAKRLVASQGKRYE